MPDSTIGYRLVIDTFCRVFYRFSTVIDRFSTGVIWGRAHKKNKNIG